VSRREWSATRSLAVQAPRTPVLFGLSNATENRPWTSRPEAISRVTRNPPEKRLPASRREGLLRSDPRRAAEPVRRPFGGHANRRTIASQLRWPGSRPARNCIRWRAPRRQSWESASSLSRFRDQTCGLLQHSQKCIVMGRNGRQATEPQNHGCSSFDFFSGKEPCQLIALQGIRRFAERRAKPPAFSQVQKRILWASRPDQMPLFEESRFIASRFSLLTRGSCPEDAAARSAPRPPPGGAAGRRRARHLRFHLPIPGRIGPSGRPATRPWRDLSGVRLSDSPGYSDKLTPDKTAPRWPIDPPEAFSGSTLQVRCRQCPARPGSPDLATSDKRPGLVRRRCQVSACQKGRGS
jgi:hypothetical protein